MPFSKKLVAIKKACKITDTIFSSLARNIGSFGTERDIARFIKKEIRSRGLRPAFEPIVGSGPGGAEPHHKPQNVPLVAGFCVIDLGVRVNGYCSDMTRTVFFGKPSKKHREIYALVLSSQKNGVKLLKDGVFAEPIWRVSYKSLGAHRNRFIHGLGHGLGKHIHLRPFLKKKSKDVLKAGDIVTVEPGVYFKTRFGIRIEDDFLVTKNGFVRLSKTTNKLLCFPVPAK
ncbi:MAG: M24 family metallopeptidase [archaeon]